MCKKRQLNPTNTASRGSEGIEVSIWDAAESEFKSGLEWSRVFPSHNAVVALDWCPSPVRQPLLSITFPSVVYIVAHQRRNTFHREHPLWTLLCTSKPLPSISLNCTAWMSHAAVVSASGPYLTLHAPFVRKQKRSRSLFEAVHDLNGQLPLYHPQFLVQCLSAGVSLLTLSLHR